MNRAHTAMFALLSLSIAQIAEAQRSSSARVGVSANAASQPIQPLSTDTAARDSTGGRHVVRGAFIGAGIGVVVGLAAAFLITHRPKSGYFDHSEDGLVILPLLELGLAAGFVVGGIVGFFWK
ncbi:MAG: hypothetical protein ACJ8AK_07435 [Gemmatimonadaceae bacterium]